MGLACLSIGLLSLLMTSKEGDLFFSSVGVTLLYAVVGLVISFGVLLPEVLFLGLVPVF